jgi:hypothetical protein
MFLDKITTNLNVSNVTNHMFFIWAKRYDKNTQNVDDTNTAGGGQSKRLQVSSIPTQSILHKSGILPGMR